MASKPHTAYRVMHSGGTYGEATPYAVVSTTSGMPHMPTYSSAEAAQQEADRLTDEARREAERIKEAAQRKAAQLREAPRTRDDGREGALTNGHDTVGT